MYLSMIERYVHMVSGLHDMAGWWPFLGLPLAL